MLETFSYPHIASVTAEYLSLAELITLAHEAAKSTFENSFKNINKILEGYIVLLKQQNVHVVQHPSDAPYQILTRTIFEQQREKKALLANANLTSEQAMALNLSALNSTKGLYSLEEMVTLDAQLNIINMKLVEPVLALIEKGNQKISLANCKVTRLPQELLNRLVNVTYLNASQNQIVFLPDNMSALKKLRLLDISGNQLSFLPESISELILLDTFIASNNKLCSLPETFGNLKLLSILDLSSNVFVLFPDPITNLGALTQLVLNYNQLSVLPETLPKLRSLTHLFVCSNILEQLPDTIGDMPSLIHLYAHGNQLTTLPDNLTNLASLETLFITNNPIKNLTAALCAFLGKEKYQRLAQPIPTTEVPKPLVTAFDELRVSQSPADSAEKGKPMPPNRSTKSNSI